MKYVEVIAETGSSDAILAVAEKAQVQDVRLGVTGEDGLRQIRMLVSDDKLQMVLDALQSIFGSQPYPRIVVMAIETSLPKTDVDKHRREDAANKTREALYEEVVKSTRLDLNYLVLVFLSTVVAAIGLIENNVAVVVGAMVIAPLLGPNLALSLGTALGDIALMQKSVKTLLAGLLLAVLLSILIGSFWPITLTSPELLSRTQVGLDSVALALASGAAAALSLTTGLPSVLVGVMVAVALLPPAATLGITLGQMNAGLAINAGLLLAINIVCVNLASKLVFFIKGIYPRTWLEKEKAKRAMVVYVIGWVVALVILMFFIYMRRSLVN